MMGTYGTYIVATLAVLVTVIVAYMKWSLTYWKRRNIPYLEASLPFGNFENPITNKKSMAVYFQEFYTTFRKMGKKCGGVYIYTSPVFLLTDPKYNKHILVKDFQYFHARGFYHDEIHQPESANLFTTDGERWRNLRVKFTPTFTSAKMKVMFNLMLESSKFMEKHVAEYAANKTPVIIKDCTNRLTADIIGSCAFGIECNSYNDNKFHGLLREIINGTTSFIKFSFCNALPNLARFLRIPLFPAKETKIVSSLIDDTVKYRMENNVVRSDFLQMVIEMKDKEIIDMNELRAQCLLFFLAGYETSATTMSYTLFELACNQDIQDHLRNEITDVLSEYDGVITYEAIMKMKYLEMVVNETLRKYPPVPLLNRKCVKNFALPNSNIIIEKDTNIMLPVIGFHFDPEYFPDPEKFDPERFSEQNKSKIVPYTFMPFGEGPRNCIGDRFGKQQIRVGLVTILRKFKLKLNSKMKLPLEFDSGFIPNPKQAILLDVEQLNL